MIKRINLTSYKKTSFVLINYDLVYDLQTETEEDLIQHFFVSQGNADIVKATQYRRTGTYENKTVFNPGFGNYDVESDTISDEDNSNNGDHYHVFNTVLSTIPDFFTRYPDDMIMVMGSDNHPDFPATCQAGCTKKMSTRYLQELSAEDPNLSGIC